jgi:hypothetical protein
MYCKTTEELLRVNNITEADDREYYSDVLTRRDYLKSSQLNRNTIMHVVLRGKEEVAILTWEHVQRSWFGLRDRLIGWTADQREQRMKYVVENRRFLMLTDEKNLASAVLSESLARLDDDGATKLGHRFLLAETFVDPHFGFAGTCYKAAGWQEIGLTCGGRGAKNRSRKLYFVKALKRDALAKLKHPEFSESDVTNPRQSVLSLERLDIKSLHQCLEAVPDYRQRQSKKYPLSALLTLILMGVLCGNSRVSDIFRWVQSLSIGVIRSLGLRQHPPYKRLWEPLNKINHLALSQTLCAWLQKQSNILATVTPTLKILSLDGKAMRAGSKAGDTEIHILTLIDAVTKVVTAQIPVPGKTNEIPVAQQLLAAQPLDANTIIIADALHTQTKTAEIILKKTPIMSSLLKATSPRLKKPLAKKRQRNNGRYQRVLKTLNTVA